LVVDDQEAIRDTLQVALDDEGFSVECAANGREALDVIGRWKPDVILLDLMMPIMDGWAFCEEQKRTGDRTPIVLLSAAGRLDGAVRGGNARRRSGGARGDRLPARLRAAA